MPFVLLRSLLGRRSLPVLWAARPGAGAPRRTAAPADQNERGKGGDNGNGSGGDPADLHDLVVEHGESVYRLALSVVRDVALAEDVAQDTLLKAWMALPSFRGDASLRSWIMRIAHNTAISALRARRALVMDPHEMPEVETSVETSVERRVESGVVLDDFVQALDHLDDLSRSIVVLRELEGMAYEEIAQILNVPLPTVKTRLLRARRRLGTAMKEWAP